MKTARRRAALVFVLATLGAGAWWAQQPIPPGLGQDVERPLVPPVGEPIQLHPQLYLVPGGGCNTGVWLTRDGVVLVDTKYREAWPELQARVRSLTDKPITHIINTHFHGDHTEGNAFADGGVEIVAHENAVQVMRELAMLPPQADGTPRPVRTFTDRLTLFDGPDAIDLYGLGPAHTNGDTLVVFRAARVIQVGDVFPDQIVPTINIEWGGHGVSLAQELSKAASGITGVDQIITGHGPVRPWSALAEYADFVQVMVDYVRREMRFGRDKREVFRAFELPDRFDGYNTERLFDTLDEIDRSIRPRWQRIW